MGRWLEPLSWFLIVLALYISGVGVKTDDTQLILGAIPILGVVAVLIVVGSDNSRERD